MNLNLELENRKQNYKTGIIGVKQNNTTTGSTQQFIKASTMNQSCHSSPEVANNFQ